MDVVGLLQALLLGVVEGLTEFLPVSSTGHQIIVADLINFSGEKAKAFNVIIQLGAILAVIWEYRRKVWAVTTGVMHQPAAQKFTVNLLIAFLPAVVLGLLFADVIKEYLFNPLTVAAALVVGGVVMIWAERREHQIRVESVDELRWQDALKIGFAQCLAMIPGTSRSGATIIGGLLFGLSRKTATEFSFFLAMPTIAGAAVYDLYKHHALFTGDDLPLLLTGFVAAFISALLAVKALLKFIAHHSYVVFGWYRIVFGGLILLTWQFGWVAWNGAAAHGS